MISGTEKSPNPKSSPLGKFLRSLESHVSLGYVSLRNGQLIREDTWERWQTGLPSRKQVKTAAKAKHIKEPDEPDPRKRIPGSKKRKMKANRRPL